MKTYIKKDIENKSIFWFSNSNQYLVFEPLTAIVVEKLMQNTPLKNIATHLESELDIPFEKAIDFVLDVQESITKPNSTNTQEYLKKPSFTKPKKFSSTKYYKFNDKIIEVSYQSDVEEFLIHPKFAHLQLENDKKTDSSFEIFTDKNFIYLLVDDSYIGSWSKADVHYFQGKVSMKFIEVMYGNSENDWMGVFHASALSKNNQSILFLGDSGNGKSTSLALLKANGFQSMADDFVPMNKETRVQSFPAAISIKPGSLDVLKEIYPELESSAEFHLKRLGKIVRYLPPKNIDYSKKLICNTLVFIKYDKKVTLEISEIAHLDAFQQLIPDSWISKIPENVKSFLDWFAETTCYQLNYSDNQKMIDKVHQLLDNDV